MGGGIKKKKEPQKQDIFKLILWKGRKEKKDHEHKEYQPPTVSIDIINVDINSSAMRVDHAPVW